MLTCCDSSIRVWETNSAEQPIPITTPLKYVNSIKYLNENRILAAGGRSSVIYFTDIYTRIQRQYDFEEGQISYITSNEDSSIIVVGFTSGKISLLQYPNFKILGSYKVHDFPIVTISYTNDYSAIISADDHGHIYINKNGQVQPFFKSGARNGVIHNFTLSPNGENIAVSSGKSLRIYSLETAEMLQIHDIGAVATVNFSPVQENVIVMGTSFGDVQIYDLNQGEVVVEHQSNIPITTTALKYDGYTFAAGHSGGVLLFDLRKTTTSFKDMKTVPLITPTQITFQSQDISYQISVEGLSVVPKPKELKSMMSIEESIDDGDYSVSKFTFKRSIQEINDTKSRMSGFISPMKSGNNSTLNRSEISTRGTPTKSNHNISQSRSPRKNVSIVAPEIPFKKEEDNKTEVEISERILSPEKNKQTPKKQEHSSIALSPKKEEKVAERSLNLSTDESEVVLPDTMHSAGPLDMFDLEEEVDERVKKIEDITQVKKDAHPYVVNN
ncbi:hypothetical protein TVAG_468600 [Trichomonas vaginalis G3]|uniref:Anaphase-promoting complex subunit 4 WD40 domain-containing protein n=1 Tax=Trichomonas vaginalis (strain ATCC PRA-98 / G3) TaxID=412133 RepID=A2F5W5_TRIV3|nr:WD40 repeat-like family [Trichomonas vaginalis G3]EAX99690.1 hypothetical protein TVAG_468600 [Trichomonas vaginalis G3]KAI5494125.1 WD40 repeat-like family [Trichomonas vaginalis G3]|eukprot:XP_001312620.1 hypothetical protein [Trichomonas vaginalis G3]